MFFDKSSIRIVDANNVLKVTSNFFAISKYLEVENLEVITADPPTDKTANKEYCPFV